MKRQMKMQLDSLFPLTDGVADAGLRIRTECYLGPRGWRIVMLISDEDWNVGAFAWDLEVEADPYVIWPVQQRRGVLAKALAIVPDLDGDGLDDIAVGIQSVRSGNQGYVLLLSGKSGEEFKRLVAPEMSPNFGASLAILRGFRAEESVLLVGSPGRSKSEGGPGGRIYAFELRSGELRASVERPPLPLGHKLGPFDYFGNVVGAINCRDRQLVLVADRQVGVSDGGDLTSSLMGIDLELGQVVWSLSGDQSFIEGPSRIFEYGNGSRFSGPLKGAGDRIVVDAHVSGPAPGRIFVIDAADGEMLFEIESSVD